MTEPEPVTHYGTKVGKVADTWQRWLHIYLCSISPTCSWPLVQTLCKLRLGSCCKLQHKGHRSQCVPWSFEGRSRRKICAHRFQLVIHFLSVPSFLSLIPIALCPSFSLFLFPFFYACTLGQEFSSVFTTCL